MPGSAAPVGQDTGLADIRALVERWSDEGAPEPVDGAGTITQRDVLGDYAAHLRGLVDLSGIRPLKVVVDAGNGMGGHTVPTVFEGLPLELDAMYFELDGSFPNHEANPLDPKNIVDLQARVRETGADLGLAFDGDADRCFVVDENGDPVSPSAITALVAARELAKHPGGTVIHNLITSWSVPEVVKENGGNPVRTRVGHSFIKEEMATTGAIFGGEHSAHYYFRDFWNADTGMLAAMHVLAALGGQQGPLSQLVAQYDRYAASGEINSTVDDQTEQARRDQGRLREPRRRHSRRAGRTDRHRRQLVVQRPRLQHRAAAPAQRRGPRHRHRRPGPRRGPGDHPRLSPGHPPHKDRAGNRSASPGAGGSGIPAARTPVHHPETPPSKPPHPVRRYAGQAATAPKEQPPCRSKPA